MVMPAIGEADGPQAGLAAVADVDPDLPRYAAVTAYLHERAGDLEHAAKRYAQASRAATSAGPTTSSERPHGYGNGCGRECVVRP